ncbi:transposase [Acidocella aminolytica]|uniref:transposase n=1 Tax=Acidocella aminolytica TaxID=33998 RepID=UPI0035A23DC7
MPLFAFSAAIRKIIYTTGAVESLNWELRKTLKAKGGVPNRGRGNQADLSGDPKFRKKESAR